MLDLSGKNTFYWHLDIKIAPNLWYNINANKVPDTMGKVPKSADEMPDTAKKVPDMMEKLPDNEQEQQISIHPFEPPILSENHSEHYN